MILYNIILHLTITSLRETIMLRTLGRIAFSVCVALVIISTTHLGARFLWSSTEGPISAAATHHWYDYHPDGWVGHVMFHFVSLAIIFYACLACVVIALVIQGIFIEIQRFIHWILEPLVNSRNNS